jgi:hypothetical protein
MVMPSSEMKRLTLQLSADVRAGLYEADLDLGKSEYAGESQERQEAYEHRARPILQAFRARGLITDEELENHGTLSADREILADRLQVLAETLLVD